MNYLPHIETNTGPNPQASVIWLHGLGADGNDFAPIVPELRLPKDLAVRFIFPHAPTLPVTINGGYVMPAWYDILDMSINRKVDIEQLVKSAQQITDLVDREIERGIDSKKIVLAGFSQGGAVALHCALTYPKPLAGLLFMSSYFASQGSITPNAANQKLAVEIHHGTADPVVPVQLGQQCFSALGAMGHPVEIKTYPMEHSVCPQQIGDISTWLSRVLEG